jgi:hypothetical protein
LILPFLWRGCDAIALFSAFGRLRGSDRSEKGLHPVELINNLIPTCECQYTTKHQNQFRRHRWWFVFLEWKIINGYRLYPYLRFCCFGQVLERIGSWEKCKLWCRSILNAFCNVRKKIQCLDYILNESIARHWLT